MNRKVKICFFFALVICQIIINRYINTLKVNLDLLYLILVYISIKSDFFKSILAATVIGLFTDYFNHSIIGIFGFSRTISAFFLNELSKYVDLKKNIFMFFIIAISLCISNLIANTFLYFISKFEISLNMILYQPVLTGLAGTLILSTAKMKKYFNVY